MKMVVAVSTRNKKWMKKAMPFSGFVTLASGSYRFDANQSPVMFCITATITKYSFKHQFIQCRLHLSGLETVGGNSGTGNVSCKCGEGWICVITRSEGRDAGQAFFKCGENCNCVVDGTVGEPTVKQNLENFSGGAYCKCGEGWTCVVSKTEGPEVGKAFFECAGDCTCAAE